MPLVSSQARPWFSWLRLGQKELAMAWGRRILRGRARYRSLRRSLAQMLVAGLSSRRRSSFEVEQ